MKKIDRVRSITNHSTGQLGKIIFRTFLEAGYSVTLVSKLTLPVLPKEHTPFKKDIHQKCP